MEQDKRVEDKKARFILLITQVVLWFMVMVMEMVVLIVKQINVSEHMLFLVSINLITIGLFIRMCGIENRLKAA